MSCSPYLSMVSCGGGACRAGIIKLELTDTGCTAEWNPQVFCVALT